MTRETIAGLLQRKISEEEGERLLAAIAQEVEAARQDWEAACRREQVEAAVDGALMRRNARSVPAAKALLPLEELQAAGDLQAAEKAVEALADSPDGAFLFARQAGARLLSVGLPVYAAGEDGSVQQEILRAAVSGQCPVRGEVEYGE